MTVNRIPLTILLSAPERAELDQWLEEREGELQAELDAHIASSWVKREVYVLPPTRSDMQYVLCTWEGHKLLRRDVLWCDKGEFMWTNLDLNVDYSHWSKISLLKIQCAEFDHVYWHNTVTGEKCYSNPRNS